MSLLTSLFMSLLTLMAFQPLPAIKSALKKQRKTILKHININVMKIDALRLKLTYYHQSFNIYYNSFL